MTEFRVIIGENEKQHKDLELRDAIEIFESINGMFYRNAAYGRKSYSLRFGDLKEGSSDIVFLVDTNRDNKKWDILPSYDLSKLCVNDFDYIKINYAPSEDQQKKIPSLKKFFSTARKTKYNITIRIENDKQNDVTFTQQDSIKIFNSLNADSGLETCLCKARVVMIDIDKKNIKLEVIESQSLNKGDVVQLKINQLVTSYCIRHHIQIDDIVSATTETKDNKKHKLLNIYSDKVNGLTLGDL